MQGPLKPSAQPERPSYVWALQIYGALILIHVRSISTLCYILDHQQCCINGAQSHSLISAWSEVVTSLYMHLLERDHATGHPFEAPFPFFSIARGLPHSRHFEAVKCCNNSVSQGPSVISLYGAMQLKNTSSRGQCKEPLEHPVSQLERLFEFVRWGPHWYDYPS